MYVEDKQMLTKYTNNSCFELKKHMRQHEDNLNYVMDEYRNTILPGINIQNIPNGMP